MTQNITFYTLTHFWFTVLTLWNKLALLFDITYSPIQSPRVTAHVLHLNKGKLYIIAEHVGRDDLCINIWCGYDGDKGRIPSPCQIIHLCCFWLPWFYIVFMLLKLFTDTLLLGRWHCFSYFTLSVCLFICSSQKIFVCCAVHRKSVLISV